MNDAWTRSLSRGIAFLMNDKIDARVDKRMVSEGMG